MAHTTTKKVVKESGRREAKETTATKAPSKVSPLRSKLVSRWAKAKKFFQETWVELRWKTSWPTREELVRSTAVVIGTVFVIALYIGLLDVIIAGIIRRIVGH